MKPGISIFYIILIMAISFSIGCEEKDLGIEPDRKVVFEVNYANSAWFKQFRGFFIDRNGMVRTYDNPVNWIAVSDSSGISASQVEENLSHTSESRSTVPVQLLEEYLTKADNISSAYTKPAKRGADHGIISYYAYLYDSKKQTYTPILLGQTGDIEIFNTDKNAAEILEWLSGVYQRVY